MVDLSVMITELYKIYIEIFSEGQKYDKGGKIRALV